MADNLYDHISEKLSANETSRDADEVSAERSARERGREQWRTYIKSFSAEGDLQAPKLSALREAMGFTQRELGDVIGLPESTIRNAENGKDVSVFRPALQRFVNAAEAAVDNKGAA